MFKTVTFRRGKLFIAKNIVYYPALAKELCS